MRRREFLAGVGTAAAWPFAAYAQARPVIGFLSSASQQTQARLVQYFLASLRDAGFEEGRNLKIEYRWAEGQFDRLPPLAAELVGYPVDVIVALGGNISALAAKGATSKIPIVFVTNDDPIATGLVASLSRPGGNLTGLGGLGNELAAKNLELVSEALPAVSVIGVLVNPKRPTVDQQVEVVRQAASARRKTIRVLQASEGTEIDAAFAAATAERIGAMVVCFDIVFNNLHPQIISLAARHAMPAVYFRQEFITAGGLMGYSTSASDPFKLSGDYAARILKGANPAELPVQQATKVDLSVNLKTAKALGLTIPPPLLARADEVIE